VKKTIATAALLALSATAVAAQGSDPDKLQADGGVKVPGWTGRIDPRPASQGRKITDAKFVPMGGGIHVTAGPAAIYWSAENSVDGGNYTVAATFSQTKASAHPEAYGLFLGGQNLEAPNQSYLYFVVRQDGKFLVNHRADDSTVHKIIDWTAHEAVKPMDEAGKATNALSIVVEGDKLSFRANGTEVASLPRATVDGGGENSGTKGIAGIRVNHNLDVHIDGFAVTKQ